MGRRAEDESMGFVTNELFIVLGLWGVGFAGSLPLTMRLWGNWGILASVAAGILLLGLFLVWLGWNEWRMSRKNRGK
jgi:hypothetical protein